MSFLVYDDATGEEKHIYESTARAAIKDMSVRARGRLPQPGETYGLREVGDWQQFEVTSGSFKVDRVDE